MKKWNLLFTLFVLTMFVISCNGGVKTLTIHPIKTETKTKGKNDSKDTVWCPLPSPCGLPKHGSGCFPSGVSVGSNHDPVGVGFSRLYDPGTQPCPCWEYVNCIYRGYVKFNVSSLKDKGILSAVLKWNNNPQIVSDTIAWEQGQDCIKSIAIANTDWNAYSIPGDYLQGNPAGSEVQVGLTVIRWVNAEIENNGWFFVGEDEKLGVKNNNDCKAVLSNIRLEVQTTEKK